MNGLRKLRNMLGGSLACVGALLFDLHDCRNLEVADIPSYFWKMCAGDRRQMNASCGDPAQHREFKRQHPRVSACDDPE